MKTHVRNQFPSRVFRRPFRWGAFALGALTLSSGCAWKPNSSANNLRRCENGVCSIDPSYAPSYFVNSQLAMQHQANVLLYTMPTCGSCKKMKQYLQERNISFVEKNVQDDPQALQEFHEQFGGGGVPLLVVQKKDGRQETVRGYFFGWGIDSALQDRAE